MKTLPIPPEQVLYNLNKALFERDSLIVEKQELEQRLMAIQNEMNELKKLLMEKEK